MGCFTEKAEGTHCFAPVKKGKILSGGLPAQMGPDRVSDVPCCLSVVMDNFPIHRVHGLLSYLCVCGK